ncbi:hypothetical protein EVA_09332 [gut metagenome]|uniref:Uncharacterized protein n=1 Tax=gut metagenome TaxID=749906 RepID=J9G5U1_9ZZZZ
MRKHRDENNDFYEDDEDEDEIYIPEQADAEQTMTIPAQDPREPVGLQNGEATANSMIGSINLFPQEQSKEPAEERGLASEIAQSQCKKTGAAERGSAVCQC